MPFSKNELSSERDTLHLLLIVWTCPCCVHRAGIVTLSFHLLTRDRPKATRGLCGLCTGLSSPHHLCAELQYNTITLRVIRNSRDTCHTDDQLFTLKLSSRVGRPSMHSCPSRTYAKILHIALKFKKEN